MVQDDRVTKTVFGDWALLKYPNTFGSCYNWHKNNTLFRNVSSSIPTHVCTHTRTCTLSYFPIGYFS